MDLIEILFPLLSIWIPVLHQKCLLASTCTCTCTCLCRAHAEARGRGSFFYSACFSSFYSACSFYSVPFTQLVPSTQQRTVGDQKHLCCISAACAQHRRTEQGMIGGVAFKVGTVGARLLSNVCCWNSWLHCKPAQQPHCSSFHNMIYIYIFIYANGSCVSCTPCKKIMPGTRGSPRIPDGSCRWCACTMLEVQCKDVCKVQNCGSYYYWDWCLKRAMAWELEKV